MSNVVKYPFRDCLEDGDGFIVPPPANVNSLAMSCHRYGHQMDCWFRYKTERDGSVVVWRSDVAPADTSHLPGITMFKKGEMPEAVSRRSAPVSTDPLDYPALATSMSTKEIAALVSAWSSRIAAALGGDDAYFDWTDADRVANGRDHDHARVVAEAKRRRDG